MSIILSQALLMLSEPKWLLMQNVSWKIENDKQANLVWKISTRTRTSETMPRGIWFRIQLWQNKPRVATFQLECDQPNVRARHVLYRMELNPFGTHVNGGHGPPHLSGLFIDDGVTHEHSYGHYGEMDGSMELSQLDPLAAVTINPPKDFDSSLAHVCATINIMNLGDIPVVPSQQILI